MKRKERMKKTLPALLILCVLVTLLLNGCALFRSRLNDLKGSITGNTYECRFYSNSGENFMTVSGTNIDIEANVVRERVFTEEGSGYADSLSSVISITVDGHQIESCGASVLFSEKGLTPDVDFMQEKIDIVSEGEGIGDLVFIANVVNRYRNAFGKGVVVLIQSQLGDPICAYSGDEVYWEVCEDLPKTTKLMIDGKALYVHRANFQIVDKALLG